MSLGTVRKKKLFENIFQCLVTVSADKAKCAALKKSKRKMAKTLTNSDRLVRFLKVETIYIYSSRLKSKATDVFGMFKFIDLRV